VALDLRGRGRVSGRPRGRPRVVANIHVGKPQTLSGERSKDLSTKVRISLALSINCHLQSPFFDYFFANRVIEAAAVEVFATFRLGGLGSAAVGHGGGPPQSSNPRILKVFLPFGL
jgi:hypothetical protein